MDARTGWTIALTALSGPTGAIAAGAALARLADATQGGMAGLAAAVAGLFIGGPIVALVVFTICAFAIARPVRRWIAIGVMFLACLTNGAVAMLGLVIVARTEASEVGLIALAIASIAVLGVGAWLALRAGNAQRAVRA